MAPLTYPPPIIISPTVKHTASVIWLHGLGDTGEGWSDMASQFKPALPHVKFSFPTAPQRSITLNGGMRMTGWYDINSLESIDMKEDKKGLMESKRYVEELVQAEVALGVPSDRVVVAGFSQGGATALMMLRSDIKLGGIVALSAYMPLREKEPIISEANKATPIFMAHGDADQVVAFQYGRATADKLRGIGADVQFNTFRGMGHTACPDELSDVQEFLLARLPTV